MYRPAHFAEDRVEILQALMRAHPFVTLASRADGELVADHLPLQLSPDGRRLLGHVARANPLWKMAAGQEVLAVFQGPQAYVSPSWYATKREHGRAVPTWNYVVVHAHGRLAAIEDPKRLRAMLDELVDHHEVEFAEPWCVGDAPSDYIDKMLAAIVGIVVGLRQRGTDVGEAMAALVAAVPGESGRS